MIVRFVRDSIRRSPRRKALVIAAIALGTAVATAMLGVMLSIGDKINVELRQAGANIVVTSKAAALTGGIGGTLRAYREHLRNPRLLATCGIGYGMLFSMVASFTFVNFRLAEPPFSLSPTKVGSIFAVYLLAMVSAPLSTRVAVRIGRIPALMLSIGCAIFGLLLTLSNSLPMVIAGLAFSTAGFLMIQALSLGFIGAIVPHARSSAVRSARSCRGRSGIISAGLA